MFERLMKRNNVIIIALIIMLLGMVFGGLTLQKISASTIQITPDISEWISEFDSVVYEESWYIDDVLMKDYDFKNEGRIDMIRGPFMSVPKGNYKLSVDYECLYDQYLFLYAPESENSIEIDGDPLLKSKYTHMDFNILIKHDLENFEMRANFDGNGYCNIKNIRLSQSYLGINRIILVVFVVCLIALVCALVYSYRKEHNNIYLYILVGISFLICLFFRIYKITVVPYGIHIDEAAIAYDSWSIANYGVDRWLNSYPIYFTNFGGGQSALLTYIISLFIKINGGQITKFLLRLPAVLINVLGWIAGVLYIKDILGKKWAVFASYLLAISPYFIMNSRFALDCNLLVNMLTISIYTFCLANKKHGTEYYIISGLMFGLTYYSYALCYIPNTMIIILIIWGMYYIERSNMKRIIAFAFPVLILGLPLALMLFINQFNIEQIKIGVFTITKLPGFRGSELNFDISNMFKNIGIILSSILAKDWLPYNTLDKFYTFYLLSIPFCIFGCCVYFKDFVKKIKSKVFSVDMLMGSVFIAYFIMGMLIGGDGPNTNKMNGIMFSVFYMLVYGIRFTYMQIKEMPCLKRNKIIMDIMVIIVCGVYFFNAILFANEYYDESNDRMIFFGDEYESIIEAIPEYGIGDKQIYVDRPTNSSYIYYLISTYDSPYEFDIKEGNIERYKNYDFVAMERYDQEDVEYHEDSIYIVLKNNEDFRKYLYEKGKSKSIIENNSYLCYY